MSIPLFEIATPRCARFAMTRGARLSTSSDVLFYAYGDYEVDDMRTTLNIDDELLAEARRLSGLNEKAALVREGLRALIERESARRLARLGGTEPQLEPVPRRRSATR